MFTSGIHHMPPSRRRVGFTLIELLVVIAIIGLLVAILFPVFGRVRDQARRSSCMSNMKQIGLALVQYTQDYDEYMPMYQVYVSSPNQYWWHDALYPYVKSVGVFNCPSRIYPAGQGPIRTTRLNTFFPITTLGNGTSAEQPSYGASRAYHTGTAQPACSGSCPNYSQPRIGVSAAFTAGNSVNLNKIPKPAETVAIVESNNFAVGTGYTIGADLMGTGTDDIYRHFEMTNTLFCDGHVKAMSADALTMTHNVKAAQSPFPLIPVAYLLTIQDD